MARGLELFLPPSAVQTLAILELTSTTMIVNDGQNVITYGNVVCR